MTKKSFSQGLGAILGETPPKEKTSAKGRSSQPEDVSKRIRKAVEELGKVKVGRPSSGRIPSSSAEEGTREGELRYTFILRKDLVDKVKGLAYFEDLRYGDVVNSALEEYIEKYEKKNGKIRLPKK